EVDDRRSQDPDRGRMGHCARMHLRFCVVARDRHPNRCGDDLFTHRQSNVLSAAGRKPVDSKSGDRADPSGLVRHRHSVEIGHGLRHRLFSGRRRYRDGIAFDISRSPRARALAAMHSPPDLLQDPAAIGAAIGEFIGSNEGLGNLLLTANSQLNSPLVWASLTVLSVLGMLLYGIVALAERILMPWASDLKH